MTDKQIIDDVDVSGCDFYIDSKNLEFNCKQTPQSYFCKNQPNCYYKQLKHKEQECERLKEDRELWKSNFEGMVGAIEELSHQLDQLKAENDLYKNAHKTEQDRRRSYENALAEIKEIAEPFCETCQKFEPEKKDRNNIYCRFCNYGKILQKISEVLKND